MTRRRATHTAAAMRKRHELVNALPTFPYMDLIPPAIALIGSVIAAAATCVFLELVPMPDPNTRVPSPPTYAERVDVVDVTDPHLPEDEIGPVPEPAPTRAPAWRPWNVCRFCSESRHEPGEYGVPEVYDREPDEGGAPWLIRR